MSGRVLQVSKEAQAKARIADLRQEMESEIPSAAPEPPPVISETLESLVEAELKKQLKAVPVQGYTIVNAIKFLAVRAKIPVAFGSELDEPQA